MVIGVSRPLKVLFVSHGGRLGGAERCLLSLVCGLDRSRCTPVVVVPHDGPLTTQLKQAGIPVHHTLLRQWAVYNNTSPEKCHLFRKGMSARIGRLAAIIEREQADVVISNSITVLDGAFAARVSGRPHAWNVLEMLSQDPGHFPLLPIETMYSWLPMITDALVAVSESVAEEFRGYLPPEKILTIHTGIQPPTVSEAAVDVRTELGFAGDTPIVTFVGMLSERKGVRTLCAAIPLVLESFPQAKFLFAGTDGGLKGHLESEISRMGIQSSVKLLGQRSDVGRLVSQSSIFVLPANADPLPVAVMEAMSLGKPVVATKSGGCSEMVDHGVTGMLVEPQAPAELAEAIKTVLADDQLAKRMGESGKARFDRMFSREQYVDRFQTLFEQLAALMTAKPIQGDGQPVLPVLPEFHPTLGTRLRAELLRSRELYLEFRNLIIHKLSVMQGKS